MKTPRSLPALAILICFLSLLPHSPFCYAHASETHTTIDGWLACENWDQHPTEDWFSFLEHHEAPELFILASKADGAYSTALGSRFHDSFREDTVGFADHLLNSPENIRDRVLFLTFSVVSTPEEDLKQDKNSIQELIDSTALTDAQSDILYMCIDTIDSALAPHYVFSNPDSTFEYQDAEKLPSFDLFGVKEMIDLHFELQNPDEGFFNTITQHFLSDPEAFLELVSDFPPGQTRHLAKGIAYTLFKSDTDASSINVNASDPGNTCAIFLYELNNPENRTIDVLKNFSPAEPTIPATETTLPAHTDPPADAHNNTSIYVIIIGLFAVATILSAWIMYKNRKRKE